MLVIGLFIMAELVVIEGTLKTQQERDTCSFGRHFWGFLQTELPDVPAQSEHTIILRKEKNIGGRKLFARQFGVSNP